VEISVLVDEGFEECPEAGWLQGVTEQVLFAQNAGLGVELGLVITSQEKVQELNRSYLGRDRPTDVLAFSMLPEPNSERNLALFVQPPDGILHLGEVIISCPQAVIQAKEHGHSAKKEIAILIIHGVLHLLGYEHDKPELERDMRTREAEILSHIKGGLD